MSRKGTLIKRKILPDPMYKSQLLTKFVNCLMQEGKKSVAQSIIYEAMEIIREKSKEDPLDIFKKALNNIKPAVEVKSRRVGGSTYQVPTEVRPSRSQALSIRWIISYSKERGEKSMATKLAGELMDASQRRGAAMKKKDDTHRMAEANKAFAHYRW